MTDVQRFDRAVAAAQKELDGKMLADMTILIETTVAISLRHFAESAIARA
jgi:hypothetical protein